MKLTGVFQCPLSLTMDVYKAILSWCVSSHVLFEISSPIKGVSLHAVSHILVQSSELKRFPYQLHWHKVPLFALPANRTVNATCIFNSKDKNGTVYSLRGREEKVDLHPKKIFCSFWSENWMGRDAYNSICVMVTA